MYLLDEDCIIQHHFGKTWFVWLDTARLGENTTRADMTGFGSIMVKMFNYFRSEN